MRRTIGLTSWIVLFWVLVAPAKGELPRGMVQLFGRLDELGRSKVDHAIFKDLHFGEKVEPVWVIQEDAKTVVVLRDDLLPWTFSKTGATRVPSSWAPQAVLLESVTPRDFEAFCREVAKKKPDKDDVGRRLHEPGPSYVALIAQAAWKRGLKDTCEQVLASDPVYSADNEDFVDKVWEDLAWLHYLRGVNLLMFADRREVLPHLRLAVQLAPESKYATASKDLLKYLEKMVESPKAALASRPAASPPERITDSQRAERYIGQLCDLWCPQMSQPGFISPYVTLKGEEPVEDGTPAARLRDMGYSAVPALIRALEDDRPTRTVFHWRDFAHDRLVWRVSDFAWAVLRDVSKRELGYQRVVGFTFSYLKPEQKGAVIEEAKRWYAETKNLSPNDRLMAMFSSDRVEDWITAAKALAAKGDRRAVPVLLPKLKDVRSHDKGDLCEVLAGFGDRTAIPAIKDVLENADEPSDRISAAIGLWKLGDASGVPIAIQYVKAEQQPYGSWDTPIWFLMLCHTRESMTALKSIVELAPPQRAGEVIGFITGGISGDLWSKRREPAGSVELAEVLVAGMHRTDEYGGKRLKDHAAAAFVLLRDGSGETFAGRFVETDPKVLDQTQTDPAARDKQIDTLLGWYERNKSKLLWDEKKHKLKLGSPATQRKP